MPRPDSPLATLPPHLAPFAPLVDAIAAAVRDELRVSANATPGPAFVDKHTSGLGPSVFLAAARAGEFDTFRVGKRFVARAADVLAYIERRRVDRPAYATNPRVDEFDTQLGPRVRRKRVAGGRTSSEP
jgi:hypothetical protein